MSTLEIFGLPEKYMEGNGHFPDWGQEKRDDRMAAAKKRALASKQKNKKTNAALTRLKRERGLDQQQNTEQKPTHFDLAPFLKALKKFLSCNGEIRSRLRVDLRDHMNTIRKIFVDEHNEVSFKKCVNIQEFGKKLNEKGVSLDIRISDNIGPIMICFGDIQYELKYTYRMPEETEEEKRAAQLKKMKEEEEKRAALEGESKTKTRKAKQENKPAEDHEEKKEEQKKEPPKPIKVTLYQTSIHDLINSMEKMQDYDFVMNELGIMTSDLTEEKVKINSKDQTQGNEKQKVQAKSVQQQNQSQAQTYIINGIYSDDHHYNDIVHNLEDLDIIPDPPEKAKNAFAVTLFCMEAAFDSRSKDFLKHAFDRFPDRDYLIVTQPHTVAENSLL